jgi:hypothetical protein
MNSRLLLVILSVIGGITVGSALSCHHAPSKTGWDHPKPKTQSPPKKPTTPTAGRDLAGYEFGGRHGCGIVTNAELPKCEASMKEARDFIWSHWTDQRRGYVIVKMASDDAQSDAHIFIEPDEAGAWHVAWNWQRIFGSGDGGRDVSGDIDAMPDIRSVERKVATDRDYQARPGTSYLSFIGEDGNEISYF